MNGPALKTYVFFCSNNVDEGKLVSFCRGMENNTVRTISLPCSGKIDIPYLMKAFESGADGVVVVTCGKDECRHVEGNLRARKRVAAVDSLLAEIGVDTGRIAVVECGKNGVEQTICEIGSFFDKVGHLPRLRAHAGAGN